MSGLSGSGKSTTAQQLAKKAGAIRLRSDAVRKHLAGMSIHAQGSDEIYTAEMSDKTYSRLISLGTTLTQLGYRVVLDAKFDRRAKRQEAIAQADTHNLDLTFVHCTAPAEVLRERVAQRSGDIADATVDILAKQSMEPFSAAATVVEVDTTRSEDAIAHQLSALFD